MTVQLCVGDKPFKTLDQMCQMKEQESEVQSIEENLATNLGLESS